MFERKVEGILTSLEIKNIKHYERCIKTLNREIKENQINFDNGGYNSTGDVSTYTQRDIELFWKFQNQKIRQCAECEKAIREIKEGN